MDNNERIMYVNELTGRIVVDVNTIEAPETIDDYTAYNPEQYQEYLYEQKRRLEESKEQHRHGEAQWNEQEDARIESLAQTMANNMGISIDDARSMITRRKYPVAPDWTVSEKAFGAVVLPEEQANEQL